MSMIKSMVLGSFLMMGLSFCVSAEVPAAPPAGLKDLGADATVELGSSADDRWNVDIGFLLKDGERTGQYKDQFVIHTKNDEPWVIVTLKSPADIKTIYIQNRTSEPQDRAKGLIVSVSNDKKTWKEIWKAADVQAEWTIDLKTPEKALYIKFELPRSAASFLHLNNIRIYGN